MRRLALGVNAIATGLLLGVLQWGVYLFLSSYMASTAIVYLATTVAWLAGGLVGLAASARADALWIWAALLAYYAVYLQSVAHPHDLRWLPPLLVAVAAVGSYGGVFVRLRAPCYPRVKWMFVLETLGFLAGMWLVFGACVRGGMAAVVALPAPLAAAAALSAWAVSGPRSELRPPGPGPRD